MRRILFAAALALALSLGAGATVVTFDDLTGQTAVPDGYGGITWGGVWTYYGSPQPPYTPNSSPNRVYDFVSEGQFSFVTPGQVFDGAWFAGQDTTTVQFKLYRLSVLVWTSGILTTSSTPTWLTSGYGGLVDTVGVVSNRPDYFVMDDVTYNGGQVVIPEPSSITLLGSGLLLGLGAALRRRRA